jgi:hypothetical protein
VSKKIDFTTAKAKGEDMRKNCWVGFLILLLPALSWADDAIPGVGLKPIEKSEEEKKKDESGQPKKEEESITILGKRVLKDSDPVGAYGQPTWTSMRRFPTTRVYVLPAGAASFEYWLRADGLLESDDRASFQHSYEMEFGLGQHLQLDLYLVTAQDKGYAPLALGEEKMELRYAFADWGKLWGNPTLYFEWSWHNNGPQALEGKLLLGDSITPRLFWGLNLVYEGQLGQKFDGEYALAFGLAYSLIDGIFSVGLEGKIALVDEKDSRFDFKEKELLFGPSFQIRPLPGVHIDLLPLFGALLEEGQDAKPAYTIYFIVGKEFSVL